MHLSWLPSSSKPILPCFRDSEGNHSIKLRRWPFSKPGGEGRPGVIAADSGEATFTNGIPSGRPLEQSLPSPREWLNTATTTSLPPSRPSTSKAEPHAVRAPAHSSLEALQVATCTSPPEAAPVNGQHQDGGGGGEPPDGYPSLAQHMANMPEATIFRSFAALNIQNLLYMQAELVGLENILRGFQLEDAAARGDSRSAKNQRKYAANWYFLSQSTSEKAKEQGEDGAQWRTMETIREKLQKYNEAIVQTMNVLSASAPSKHDLRDIQEYLPSVEMTDGKALTGMDGSIWGCVVEKHRRDHAKDLITLLPRQQSDHLTRFVINWVVGRLHDRKAWPDWLWGRGDVSEKTIYRLTFGLTSGVASMLPVLSMVALQQVEAVQVRGLSLGLIALFNFILAVLLTWWTSVKRGEVFAIAAAFAAVNVVFITK